MIGENLCCPSTSSQSGFDDVCGGKERLIETRDSVDLSAGAGQDREQQEYEDGVERVRKGSWDGWGNDGARHVRWKGVHA
jgi:hypothetical protein